MTQAQVAKHLEVTANHYQAIELGASGTSEKNWLKLYHLFGEEVALHELMVINTKEPDCNQTKGK